MDLSRTGWLVTVVVCANGFFSCGSRWIAERTRIRTTADAMAAARPASDPTLGVRAIFTASRSCVIPGRESATRAGSDNSGRAAYCAWPGKLDGHVQVRV